MASVCTSCGEFRLWKNFKWICIFFAVACCYQRFVDKENKLYKITLKITRKANFFTLKNSAEDQILIA